MKKKNLLILGITALSAFILCGISEKVAADEVGVTTSTELVNAINTASSERTVFLNSNFTLDITATIALKESAYPITVDGKGFTLSSSNAQQIFSYAAGSGNTNSSLTIKNLNLEGLGQSVRALTVGGYQGNFILENVKINDFHSYDDGGAFYTSGNTLLKNCTFSNNTNVGSGYSGGAIASKGFSANFSAMNCKFVNNQTMYAGTGNVGGEGGAIYFFQPSSTSTFKLTNNYFEGNKAVESVTSGSAKLADGGAIAFFNTAIGTNILFDGNTFTNNIAGDDGGAILIQTNDNIDSGILFTNNTFYKNKALGQDLSANSGGAIQIYANGSILQGRKVSIDYVNNSFVENEAAYDGGAIGSYGYGTNLSAGRYYNNLFVGNKSRTESKNNVADSTNVSGTGNLSSNIGYDNGSVSPTTISDVFGVYPVTLVENHNMITAGTTTDLIILPTLPIAPEKVADDQVENLNGLFVDQRNFSRSSKADVGAIEIDWIKYDSNGGTFNLPTALTQYDGEVYYEGTSTQEYYQVGYDGLSRIVPNGTEDLKATKEKSKFLGWSSDKEASTPDENFAEGNEVKTVKNNLTLYAVWGTVTPAPVTVKFMAYNQNQELISIAEDQVLNGELNASYQTQAKEIQGYTFKEVQGNPTGVFTTSEQIVTYIYTENLKKSGEVLVSYIDQSGNKIADDEILQGNIGEAYQSYQKEIEGYTFKKLQGQAEGQFTNEPQKVTYIYDKISKNIPPVISQSSSDPKKVEEKTQGNSKDLPETGDSKNLLTGITLGLIALVASVYLSYKKTNKWR